MRTFDSVCAHGDEVNDLSETEYHYLLHVLCENGTYEDLEKVLNHMSSRLESLSEIVLATLRVGFQTGVQARMDKKEPWDVSSVYVDPQVRRPLTGSLNLIARYSERVPL